MKTYLLSVYQPEGPVPPPEVLAEIGARLEALRDEMRAAGSWVFSGGLHAQSTATTVRAKGGDTLVTDGPFAEAKEYLAGLTILRAADLDAALDWARRLAVVIEPLTVEVRPFQVADAG